MSRKKKPNPHLDAMIARYLESNPAPEPQVPNTGKPIPERPKSKARDRVRRGGGQGGFSPGKGRYS